MEVLIRPFRPPDWDGLFFLDQACFVPPYRLEYPRLRGLVQDPTVIVLVAEAQEGDESGLVGGMLVKLEKEAGRLVLIAIMIDPGFRRVGLGRRLMGWAHRIARANTLDLLLAPLEAENEGGAAFLASLGFVSEPGTPPFFDDPAGGNVWSRAAVELEPPSRPIPSAQPVPGATEEAAVEPASAESAVPVPDAPEAPDSGEATVQAEVGEMPASEASVPTTPPAGETESSGLDAPAPGVAAAKANPPPAPKPRKPGRVKHTGPRSPASGHKAR